MIGYTTLGKSLSVLGYRAVAALVRECPCPYVSVESMWLCAFFFLHGKMPTNKGQQQNKTNQSNMLSKQNKTKTPQATEETNTTTKCIIGGCIMQSKRRNVFLSTFACFLSPSSSTTCFCPLSCGCLMPLEKRNERHLPCHFATSRAIGLFLPFGFACLRRREDLNRVCSFVSYPYMSEN